jgi:CDP-diacylglycerol--serine O-phosphatidyltransferase
MNDHTSPPKHFSMIRSFHFSDLFTIANGVCGVASIFHALVFYRTSVPSDLYKAAMFIPLALVLDVLDGAIARKRSTASAMGREMDSLADLISFGVAPAVIAYAVGMNTLLDQIVLIYFACCGLSRLARFNITAESLADQRGKVKYFEGTPIPTSIIPLALTVLAYRNSSSLFPVEILGANFHLVTFLYLVSGSLMISKTIHIPKP